MDAFASDDLRTARQGFAAVLGETPEDTEAEAMLRRTEIAIGRRASQLLEGAQRSLRSGLPADAQTLLDQAARLDPDAPGLGAVRAALARAQQPPPTDRATAPKRAERPSVSRLDDRELERLYSKGLAAYEQRRLDDAVRYWELVWSSRPGYREVNDLLKREYLTRGIEAFGAGRLEEAIAHWQKVLRIDPADERARGYLARAQKQMARSREILEERR
jgi:tetratricopeptide (TPR) repeat protein